MTVPVHKLPANEEMATLVVGSIVWAQIVAAGHFHDPEPADMGRCLDVLARCEEHGVKPDAEQVLLFIAGMIQRCVPEATFDECMFVAGDLIRRGP